MRKYAWLFGLVFTFFGGLEGIQTSIRWLRSNDMTIRTWALLLGGLIILYLVVTDIVATKNKRKEEMRQIRQDIKALENKLSKYLVYEKGPVILQLAQKVGALEEMMDILRKNENQRGREN